MRVSLDVLLLLLFAPVLLALVLLTLLLFALLQLALLLFALCRMPLFGLLPTALPHERPWHLRLGFERAERVREQPQWQRRPEWVREHPQWQRRPERVR